MTEFDEADGFRSLMILSHSKCWPVSSLVSSFQSFKSKKDEQFQKCLVLDIQILTVPTFPNKSFAFFH